MTKETTRIARGATAVFSSSFFANLLMFVFYIAITHLLDTRDLGVLYSFNVVDSFMVTFLMLSLPSGFSRFIVGYYQTNRVGEARYLFRRGLLMATLITSSATPVLVLLAPFVTKLLTGQSNYIFLYYLVVVDFVTTTYSSFLGIVVSARRIFGWGSVVQVLSTVSRVGVGVGLLLGGFGLRGVLLGWIASDVVSIAAYLHFSRSFLVGESIKAEMRGVITYSLPFFIASGLVVVLQNVDRLFVLRFLGTVSLGVYGTLLIASNIPKMLPGSVSSTLFPVMIKYEEEKALTRNVVSKAVRYMALINLPVLGLVAALGAPLLYVFLGRAFSDAWPAFSILVFGGGAMSLDIPITQVLLAKRKTRVLAVQQVVSSFALAILAVTLIPKLYLVGAALAYVIARIVGFIITGSRVYRLGLFSIRWRDYLKTFGVTLGIISVTLTLEHYTDFWYPLLPIYILVGSLTGIVMAKVVGLFHKDDYLEVAEFFPPRLRGIVNWAWRALRLPMASENT
ncbi:MAG TPA: oligosaccharide flippase family protein [bacterium]|nr:oligosaccharide flippase family protein [bacterium]